MAVELSNSASGHRRTGADVQLERSDGGGVVVVSKCTQAGS
jgi:hypothetical protein